MPKEVYDHHKKAGNQGDVIKHVALIAALDKVLDEYRGSTFRYADTFAGYARNPLVRGNEWAQGIGKIFQCQSLNKNEHTEIYKKWYLSRPQLVGGIYPGSSLIASDMCLWKGKKVHLSLWDTSPQVIADLKTVFSNQKHSIYPRPAIPSDQKTKSADFLLIDPPQNSWDAIREFLANHSQAVLVWLPVSANTTSKPPAEDELSKRSRKDALKSGLAVTKVRWSKGGRTIGCQLIYRLPGEAKSAVQNAVGHVADTVHWKYNHYDYALQ